MSGSAPAPGQPARPHPAVADRRRSVVRARGRKRRAAILWSLGIAFGLVLLYWLATGPLLAVHDVNVTGYERDDSAQLVTALQSAAGDGTIIVPATGEMRAAAERFPWVASISVSRTWPRGLKVVVSEAKPVAIASFGGTAVMVSAAGRVLGPTEAGRSLGTVRLAAQAPAAGQTLPEEETATLAFLDASKPAVAASVRDLHVDRAGQVSARLVDGPQLRLGAPDRMVAKARALALMLKGVPAKQRGAGTYIDLSVPENPALGSLSSASVTTTQ
jgi:cell division protein FtsQ